MTLVGLEETLDLRWFKWHRATAYYNIAVDLDYTPKLYPQSLRLGTLRYLPSACVPDAAAAPTDVLRFLRAVHAVDLLSPTDRWDRWHASVRDYIDNRVDEAGERRAGGFAQTHRWQHQAVHRTDEACSPRSSWTGCGSATSFCTSIENGRLRSMLKKWYDGDNAFVFQDLISGIPVTTLLAQETQVLFRLAERIRNSSDAPCALPRPRGRGFSPAASTTSEDSRDSSLAYSEFLRDNGHRGQQDRDMYYARRVEDPRLDYEALRTILDAGGPGAPQLGERSASGSAARRRFARRSWSAVSATAPRPPEGRGVQDAPCPHHEFPAPPERLATLHRSGHPVEEARLPRGRPQSSGAQESRRDASGVFFLRRGRLSDLLEGRASIPWRRRRSPRIAGECSRMSRRAVSRR